MVELLCDEYKTWQLNMTCRACDNLVEIYGENEKTIGALTINTVQ